MVRSAAIAPCTATGRIRQRPYVTGDGEKRTVHDLQVDDAGPSLSRARAKVARFSRSGNGQAAAAAETARDPCDDPPPF
jgi:single-strand DNA-binding protein